MIYVMPCVGVTEYQEAEVCALGIILDHSVGLPKSSGFSFHFYVAKCTLL